MRTDTRDKPLTWIRSDGGKSSMVTVSETDYFDKSDHYTTASSSSANRLVHLPPYSSSKRKEQVGAYASVQAENYTMTYMNDDKEYTAVADGEYCLYTKVVFHDKTGLFKGIDTLEIGENSTIRKGIEYFDIVNHGAPGVEYLGEFSRFDVAASDIIEVKGKNRLGAIAKSWVKNSTTLELSEVQVTLQIYHIAATKAWL